MITTIMASFAFGYCIVDFILNYRSERRLNQFMKEFENHD